jgi:hypothetical protein
MDIYGEVCGRAAEGQRVGKRRRESLGSRMIRWRARDMVGSRWRSSSLSLSIVALVFHVNDS